MNSVFATWHDTEYAAQLARAYNFDVSRLIPPETWDLLKSLQGKLGPANYADAELSLEQQFVSSGCPPITPSAPATYSDLSS
jgi:hypothetical protein